MPHPGRVRDIRWMPMIGTGIVATGILTVILGSAALVQAARSQAAVRPSAIVVPVTIDRGGQTTTFQTMTTTATLADVLARTANDHGQTFRYQTRGQSMYPVEFWGRSNDASGRWVIRLNTMEIQDLQAAVVHPGDHIFVQRLPSGS